MRIQTILHRIHKIVNQRPTTQKLKNFFLTFTSSFTIRITLGGTEDSMMHKLWETVSVLFLRWSLVLSLLYSINFATEFPYNLLRVTLWQNGTVKTLGNMIIDELTLCSFLTSKTWFFCFSDFWKPFKIALQITYYS